MIAYWVIFTVRKTLHAETGRGYKGEYIRLEPRGPGSGPTGAGVPADCGEVGRCARRIGRKPPLWFFWPRGFFFLIGAVLTGTLCRVRLSGIGGAL